AGEKSDEGSNACTECEAGEYSVFGSTTDTCEVCEPGKYAEGTKNVACSLCISGKYSDTAGATTCVECVPGKYRTSFGSTFCEVCQAGRYSGENGKTNCDYCNKLGGSTQGMISGRGATECTPCPAGTEAGLRQGVTFCTACPGGKSSSAGESGCDDCESGKYSDHPAAVTSSPTPAPTMVDTNAPTATPTSAPSQAYSYAYDEPTAAPTSAPTGSPTPFVSSAPTIWDPNPDVIGVETCTPCEAGKYSSGEKAFCDLCPAGRYSLPGAKAAAGSGVSDNTCRECEAGKFSFAGSAECIYCPDNPPSTEVYTSYSEEEDASCYSLATAESMRVCPASTRSGVDNVCRWWFIEDFSNSLESSNVGEVSPFGDSCGNYTLCSANPLDNDFTDSLSNKDVYQAMCLDCAEGYESAGTIPGSVGECAGGTFQRYCYRKNDLDVCPQDTECHYAYGGSDGDEVEDVDAGERSPFALYGSSDKTGDGFTDVTTTSCAEYRVCGFEGGTTDIGGQHLEIVCTECAPGFAGYNFRSTPMGDLGLCSGNTYPTACFDALNSFDTCPAKLVDDWGIPSIGERRRAREAAVDHAKFLSGSVRGRKLPVACAGSFCSCTISSFGGSCDPDDNCQSADEDCDPSICSCTNLPDNGDDDEDSGGGGGISTSDTDCNYIFSEWEDLDADDVEDGDDLWDTDWVEKDENEASPFFSTLASDPGDTCKNYILCEVDLGTFGDEYHIACAQCDDERYYYPAIDPNFNDYKGTCSRDQNLPTACYRLTPSKYENHDYRYCRDITDNRQEEHCFYWHDDEFVERTPTPLYESPFSDGCSRYDVCEAGTNAAGDMIKFDPFDGEEDHFYVTCAACTFGWTTVYGDWADIPADKRCAEASTMEAGKVIIDCLRPETPSPTPSPTRSPTASPTTSPTNAPDIGDTTKKYAKKVLDDPKLLGGVVAGAILIIGGAIFLVRKSRNKGRSDSDYDSDYSDDESRDRKSSWDPRGGSNSDGAGFEMSNPMKESKKSKKKDKRNSAGVGGGAAPPPPPPPDAEPVKDSNRAPEGMAAPPPPPAAPGPPPAEEKKKKKEKPTWVAKVDPNSQQTFYYNRKTKAVSWTPPPEMLAEAGGGAPAPAPAPAPPPPPPAPPAAPRKQFEAHVDPGSGATYYIDIATGASQWDEPPPGTF
ncbi:hypothetical protein TeGR_g13213, partial [Tetraparma gracilis]